MKINFVLGFLMLILFSGFALAVSPYSSYSFTTTQTYAPSFNTYYGSSVGTYWPILDNKKECTGREDILLLRISPGGCQPSVVRSDLLAEQNVPVFCQVEALNINPLIDVNEIRDISFTGKYPSYVSGTGFHPARAALRTKDRLLGDPSLNNIGYVVVMLKKQANESALPESVSLNLSARIIYDSGNVLGVGRSEFLLNEQSDEDFNDESKQQTFWNGKYKIRLLDADETGNYVNIGIYSGDRMVGSTRVLRGQTSSPIYVPGSYCQAYLTAQFVGFENDKVKARISVGDGTSYDTFDVYEGASILNGKCRVRNIYITSYNSDKSKQISNKQVKTDKTLIDSGSVVLSCSSGTVTLSIGSRLSSDGSNIQDKFFSNEIANDLNKSFEYYQKVAKEFGAEMDKGQAYGQEALNKAIVLAKWANQDLRRIALMKLYIEKYPNTEDAFAYTSILSQMEYLDYSSASKSIEVDGRFNYVTLEKVSLPNTKATARLSYGKGYRDVEVGRQINLTEWGANSAFNGNLRLVEVGNDYVRIESNCEDYRKNKASFVIVDGNGVRNSYSSDRLPLNGYVKLCEETLTLNSVDSKKVAKIILNPNVRKTETVTNLSVSIGIEKRAIKLNPEKTAEKIKSINETISQWESINNNLGKVVTGLKSACFATAGVLTVKNFFSGLSGEALARQQVMPYWTEYCKNHIGKSDDRGRVYSSLDDCILDKSSLIKNDVNNWNSVISSTNSKIKSIESEYGITRDNGIFGKTVDSKEAAKKLAAEIKSSYPDKVIKTKDGKDVKVSELLDDKSIEGEWISYSEIRDLYSQLQVSQKSGLSDAMSVGINDALSKSADRMKEEAEGFTSYTNSLNAVKNGLPKPTVISGTKVMIDAEVLKISDINEGMIFEPEYVGIVSDYDSAKSNAEYFARVQVNTKSPKGGIDAGEYIVSLNKNPEGKYNVANVYRANSDSSGKVTITEKLDETKTTAFKNDVGAMVQSTKEIKLIHSIQNPQARFYENEPYKGMPAVVPIDIAQGWYAGTRQTIAALGAASSFDSSGRVTSFYLCNVMDNGKIDFDSGNMGDDKCERYDLSGSVRAPFPGLTESETKKWVDKGVSAIQEAARQYGTNRNVVSILGKQIPVGRPVSSAPETSCWNFMSPGDCKLLFNVCDPVICPASRCNFGGQYSVSDVIQSGIIGSALLCLPNINQGVYVPVCLTGIHAGIENYVSILKSHRDCLSENLKSGQMIGICDQIYSIYSCEFFWNQMAPLMRVLIPKAVGLLYGQGNVRGGGEYASVLSAWTNAENSVKYMTQIYGVNAFKAFQLRNIEQAGTEFCKSFVSTSVPTSLKSLSQPDSPPQFSAYFDSEKFSDATVPATSQYHVYYHIYAGNDIGVSYRVYLRNPPESSYYVSNQYITVATGFIAKGQSADEKKDFTAPEGYKELCVNINGEEKCGFKQVSTSFAVNYIKDVVIKDVLTETGIDSETKCISGSVGSTASLLNPNIQSATQEALNPSISSRGITRVCASENPGKSTSPTRYVQVGTCGNSNLKCWLDKDSVSNAITDNNIGVKNATLSEITKIQEQALIDGKVVLSREASISELDILQGQVSKYESNQWKDATSSNVSSMIQKLQTLLGIGDSKEPILFWNNDKARAWFILGQIYDGSARKRIHYFANIANSESFIISDSTGDIYITYDSGWKMSREGSNWDSISYEGIENLDPSVKGLLSELMSLNYQEGSALINDYLSENNQGSQTGQTNIPNIKCQDAGAAIFSSAFGTCYYTLENGKIKDSSDSDTGFHILGNILKLVLPAEKDINVGEVKDNQISFFSRFNSTNFENTLKDFISDNTRIEQLLKYRNSLDGAKVEPDRITFDEK